MVRTFFLVFNLQLLRLKLQFQSGTPFLSLDPPLRDHTVVLRQDFYF